MTTSSVRRDAVRVRRTAFACRSCAAPLLVLVALGPGARLAVVCVLAAACLHLAHRLAEEQLRLTVFLEQERRRAPVPPLPAPRRPVPSGTLPGSGMRRRTGSQRSV